MKVIYHKFFYIFAIIITFAATTEAQKTFEGYSLVVQADNGGACPIRYMPTDGNNQIQVFVAGTNLRTPATGLTACDQSRVQGSQVIPAGSGKWCFQGAEDLYEIRLTSNVTYIWHPIDKNTGFHNVMDFRPVTRTGGATPKYEHQTPADYTQTIRNAIAFIASRQGGTLFFPDGDYIVGTTDGNTRDPRYEAITLPPGITVEGVSSNLSVAGSDLPIRTSGTRLRLRNDNQAIFRIGGCTNRVTVRNIELMGNSPLFREAPRSQLNTYGVEGLGKSQINPATKVQSVNSTQFISFDRVTFQDFDKGIFVHNANETNCNPQEQVCTGWQFDYVTVDHGVFINNKTGILIDTFNTDWKVSNTFMQYHAANAPGRGIHIKRGGTMLIEQSFGGGNNYTTHIGGAFVYVDTIGSLTIVSSASEAGQYSIYTAPYGSVGSLMLTIIGSVFADKMELNGRINFISTGNFYYAKTVQTAPGVTITSTGDRFCHDPLIFPGVCKDEAGRNVSEPGFGEGRLMFRTGRIPEGAGADLLKRRPNFFGYDLEINKGILQHDPDITFRDITAFAAENAGGTRVKDGAIAYCKDCRKNASGICTQGTAGTDGAFAKRVNNQWRCD